MKKAAIYLIVMSLVLAAGSIYMRKTMNAAAPAEHAYKIVIDPGHGGIDSGMTGIGEIQEKKINLEVSIKLKSAFEKRNIKAVLTREEDCGLYDETAKNKKAQDLQNRIQFMKTQTPVLAISIHQNSYEDPDVCGPQVFYYKTSEEGKKLAECIQKYMNDQLNIRKPRAAKSNETYYLLKRSECVLNIVECGFLTNPQEAALLKTEEYQEKAANAIADGVLLYLKNNSK